MSLVFHYHPLSSFCHKALIALYENDASFTPKIVDLGDPAQRAEFVALWPIGKFPVLQDITRGKAIPESTIIIEYLDQHHPGKGKLIPDDPEQARQAFAASQLPIDLQHKEVMAEVHEGPAEVELLFDIRAEGE